MLRLLSAFALAAHAALASPHHLPRTTQGARSRVSSAPASAYSAGGGGVVAVLASFPSTVADNGTLNITLLSLSGASPSPDDFISLTCGDVASPGDFLDAVTLDDIASQEPVSVVFTALPFLRCSWVAKYWSTASVRESEAPARRTNARKSHRACGVPNKRRTLAAAANLLRALLARRSTSPA